MSATPEALPDIRPEMLQAFVENRLDGDGARLVAARIAADPEFALHVEDQKRLLRLLRSPAANWARAVFAGITQHGGSLITAAASAGGIALGVTLAASNGWGTDFRGSDGSLIAQAELAQALSEALPSEDPTETAGAARVGASFWSRSGSFCRSFLTRETAGSALAGIACQTNGTWQVVTVMSVSPFRAAGTRLTRADFPAPIRNTMENLMVGEPLSAEAERQARRQGWRPR